MDPNPTKVVLRRGAAFLVDTIPGFVLYWALIASIGTKVFEEPGTNWVMQTEIINGDIRAQLGDDVYHLTGGDFALVTVVAMAYWIGLFVVLQGLTGATIGKALFAIRTVDIAGRPCGIGRATVRWLLIIVDAIPYFFPIVGLATGLASDGNRRVGDMAAQTYVVRRSAVGHPVRPGTAAQPAGFGPPQWDPRLEAYVCWDAARQVWLRWDAGSGRWEPLTFDPRGGSLDV
jgi:uncharacterized RDD family membrane protein YckC